MSTRVQNPEDYNHYVYLITNLVNGKRYIGKRSCKCKIEEDYYWGSGILLEKARKKYGMPNFTKEILEICVNENECLKKEIYYIELYDAFNSPEFYNLTKGGEGTTGHKATRSEEVKEKMSKRQMGKKNSEEAKEKMRKNAKSKKCICLTTGEVFRSLAEAGRAINERPSEIRRCIKGDYLFCGRDEKTSERLKWAYLNEDGSYTTNCFRKSLIERKVMCVTTGKIYRSVAEAGRSINEKTSDIRACLKGRLLTIGVDETTGEKLQWAYVNEDGTYVIEPLKESLLAVKVKCLSTGKVYKSIAEAERDTGVHRDRIIYTCKKEKTSKKYSTKKERLDWEYYTEDLAE